MAAGVSTDLWKLDSLIQWRGRKEKMPELSKMVGGKIVALVPLFDKANMQL